MGMTEEIAKKYADKRDPLYEAAINTLGFFYQMIGQYRPQFEALIKAEENMHNFGIMIDPTLYRDMLYSKNLKPQIKMVQAALAFLDVLDEVNKEL